MARFQRNETIHHVYVVQIVSDNVITSVRCRWIGGALSGILLVPGIPLGLHLRVPREARIRIPKIRVYTECRGQAVGLVMI